MEKGKDRRGALTGRDEKEEQGRGVRWMEKGRQRSRGLSEIDGKGKEERDV